MMAHIPVDIEQCESFFDNSLLYVSSKGKGIRLNTSTLTSKLNDVEKSLQLEYLTFSFDCLSWFVNKSLDISLEYSPVKIKEFRAQIAKPMNDAVQTLK